MKNKNLLLLLLSPFLWISCTKDQGPFIPEIAITTVSYETDVQPIFDSQCTSCHTTVNNQFYGYLDLSISNSYDNLVNVISNGYAPNIRVVPDNPEASVLIKKIDESGVYGATMPLGGILTSSEKEILRVWIQEGALNN